MSLHKRRVRHKRDGYLPLSGSVVVSDTTPTATYLAQNTVAVTNLSAPPSGIPLVAPSASEGSSTSTTPSSTPTATVSSSTSSDQISLGTVIGACVAALIALLLSVLLAIYCSRRHKLSTASSRNAANNASRRRSHLEPWKRMDGGGDRWEGKEQSSMEQRPTSGPLGAMFHRTNSNTSGEKSSDIHNRESVGTMQNFAKYHPGLAAEMASQGAVKDIDGQLAKPPPVLRLMNRGSDMTPPVSLDGDTVRGDSFFSLHSGLSNSKSPFMIVTERLTPPATTSTLHRWESAEVLHVNQIGSDFSGSGELQNPFSDKASTVKSSLKGRNPFFSAQDHHPVRRTLLPDTHENPFADANSSRDSSDAIRSLIAALEVPHEQDSDRIVSLQSSLYSRATADDGDSAISVTAFPYPPSQVTLR